MAGPLSFAQEEALRALFRGERFGIDARTERGLEHRGLVTLRDVTTADDITFHHLPYLTEQGAIVAARLAAAQDLAAGVRRIRNGFRVIDGGLA